ncbi:YkgJ family cysteine cluster protein [Planctomycetota bacterium]
MTHLESLIQKVEDLYVWIDEEIRTHVDPTNDCNACGACCDFENYDHRLFITPPEILYFARRLGTTALRRMETGQCPYMESSKCTAYTARFAGCRIFGCRRDEDLQSRWTETALKQLKAWCQDHDLELQYTDLATALNNWGVALVAQAGESQAAHAD